MLLKGKTQARKQEQTTSEKEEKKDQTIVLLSHVKLGSYRHLVRKGKERQ